jgi:protein-S-isoprenylcysteine O-methyltransferase Ste14
VFEAQQALVVRRVDLLIEESTAKIKSLVAISVGAAAGAIAAFAGWFIAMAGVIDALGGHFPRPAVEIAVGALHVAAGAALAYYLFRRRTPEVPS